MQADFDEAVAANVEALGMSVCPFNIDSWLKYGCHLARNRHMPCLQEEEAFAAAVEEFEIQARRNSSSDG